MAPDESTSQEVTSVPAVSTHSSRKSDDGGYVQVIPILKGDLSNNEVNVTNSILVIY
jgi:hypothetical protein